VSTFDVARLRQLSLSWRWWAAHQCADNRAEAAAWRGCARELETIAGLPTPTPEEIQTAGARGDDAPPAIYAIVPLHRLKSALNRPAVCTLTAQEVTTGLGRLPRPLNDYRVLRRNGDQVELAYTAHEWMREKQ
jgi:hypothetical protein